jgi:hypothetical protein
MTRIRIRDVRVSFGYRLGYSHGGVNMAPRESEERGREGGREGGRERERERERMGVNMTPRRRNGLDETRAPPFQTTH